MSVIAKRNMTSNTATRNAALVLLICTVSLTSCVSNISSQVKESNKDTTGAFDGTWIANVQKSPARQPMPGNWTANCRGSEWDFRIQVVDGVAKNNFSSSTDPAYVSTTGDFRFDMPLNSEAKGASGAERSISRGQRTIVIYGNLQTGKGRYTLAIAEFGNNGCTAIIEFEKIES